MNWNFVENKTSNRDVKIFALSTCIWCKKTKQMMDEHDISYKYLEVDLLNETEKENAVNEMNKFVSNISFPLTVIDDVIVIKGFQEEELKRNLNV